MGIVSNSEEEGVILEVPSSNKQTNARMHWFFTFNNYSEEDIKILKKVFDELCFMYAFQEEMGESGTRHLQGVISMKKRARWTEFGLPKRIHWEKVVNVKDAYLYCTKNDTRCGVICTKNYELPYYFKIEEHKLYDWQKKIISLIKTEADDRSVHWVWSEKGGVGKSKFVKHLVLNHGGILLTKGKYSDICNLIFKMDMSKTNLVVFDLPRNCGNKISYDAIESIKNGMITNTKYETGFKAFKEPHIVIFANEEPEYEKLYMDRWHVMKID